MKCHKKRPQNKRTENPARPRGILNPSQGGKALFNQRGTEYMAELGRKSAATRTPEHYAKMAAASAIVRRRIYAAGKAALAKVKR